MDYFQIAELSGVYLEDSYVMAIHEYDDKLVFDLDVVLTEIHPSYEDPLEGERYCFRRASLCFLTVSAVEWKRKKFVKFSDTTGECDYGNIDSFTKEGDSSFLTGDWGEVRIIYSSIELNFID